MKRLVLGAAVLLLAGLLFWWWHSAHRVRYVNFPPTATGEWIAFGDSLTHGYGASEGKDYPTRVAQTLGVKIRNLGVDGDSTTTALNRLETAAVLHPRVVLLCLGGNDALEQTQRDRTFTNLGTIIDRFHREGSFVVLIGVRSATLRDKNETYFAKLAGEKNVFYIPDILSGVMFKPVLMSDAVHPNEAGYQLIGERIAAELQPLMPQLQ